MRPAPPRCVAKTRILDGVVLAAVIAGACGSPPSGTDIDAGNAPRDAAATDARTSTDADAALLDAALLDAAALDAAALDAAPLDAAPSPDATSADAMVPGSLGIKLVDQSGILGQRSGGRPLSDPLGIGSGLAAGDLDGDGRVDLVLARCDHFLGGPSEILWNDPQMNGLPLLVGDLAFAAANAGTCAHAVALGDYDRDGDLDIFLARKGGDSLWRNDGGRQFIDITDAAGVGGPSDDANSGAIWVDVDRDGQLDLYVLAHVHASPPASSPLNRNRLYLNRAGRFTEVAVASGVAGDGSSQAVLAANLDADPDLELVVANDRFSINGGPPIAGLDPDTWHDPVSFNDEGVPTYANRAAAYGLVAQRSSMGIAPADLDEDGHLDLYISDWGANALLRWNPALLRYDDQAASYDVAQPLTPLGDYFVTWGSRFLDLDRNGVEELAVVNGSIFDPFTCNALNQLDRFLWRAPGAVAFTDVTGAIGWPNAFSCTVPADRPAGGRGLVVADIDGDHRDDLLVSPYVETYRFFWNLTPTTGERYLRVSLQGTVSAPDPIGARLEVVTAGKTLVRQRYAGGTTQSQSDNVLEVGLAGLGALSAAWIHWPSGYSQRLDAAVGFALNQPLTISEPAWLTVEPRAVAAAAAAQFLFAPVDERATPLGVAGAGKNVVVARSDGLPVVVTDRGDGTYTAPLPHPGVARVTRLSIAVDGVTLAPRPTIRYD